MFFDDAFQSYDGTKNVRLYQVCAEHPVVEIRAENSRWRLLHSRFDPEGEARLQTENFSCPQDAAIVILGAGSGYHIAELRKKFPDRPLVVIEKIPEIIALLNKSPAGTAVVDDPATHVILSNQPASAVNDIISFQKRHNCRCIAVFCHPASTKAFPEFYNRIAECLADESRITTADMYRYRKFIADKLRILILHSKYYLLPEILNSLNALGHTTQCVMFRQEHKNQCAHEVIERILSEVVRFKPDFVLTVNHLGFDRSGILTEFFTDIELPYASWFVDNPLFILEDFGLQVSPFAYLFVWDRDYVDDLNKRGFEHVAYLPLASDPGIFTYISQRSNPLLHLSCNTGFVGNSGSQAVADCLNDLGGNTHDRTLLDKVSQAFWKSDARHVSDINLELNPDDMQRFNRLCSQKPNRFEPAVTWRATQMYRVCCLKHLMRFSPHIHGDPGWHNLINGTSTLLPELNYYNELPYFYNVCMINFNTTSLQMRGGANQRVFDVSACGAFLITDYREQLCDMFREGDEIITYKDPEEAADLVHYYLHHDGQRIRIAEKAYAATLARHTYIHRLQDLIHQMRRVYA